jgi:hypothetical protein
VQARDNDPVALAVEQRQGEALVAAGVLERIETDHADMLDRAPALFLNDWQSTIQPVDALGQLVETPKRAFNRGSEVGWVDTAPPAPAAPHSPRQHQHPGQRDQCHQERGDGNGGCYVGGHGAAF